MGLAERRALKSFQDDRLPTLLAQIKSAGQLPEDVPVDIQWDTLAIDDSAHLYDENWPKVYFQPVIAAFKEVARDDMGREALSKGVKRIVIQNMGHIYYGDRWANLRDGVLTLDHEPTTNSDNVDERTKGLIEVLEKGL